VFPGFWWRRTRGAHRSELIMANSEVIQRPHLQRRFGLLQATALNMSNMIGIGPFMTIPLLMSTLGGGPQAMLGWVVALLIVIPDGMIWSELGAAMPGSGGSYVYLREGYGPEKWGRLMAFLFIWQFLFSGPLEIASGYVGMTLYASYLLPGFSKTQLALLIAGVGVLNIFLLYRRITSIGRITVSLWAGVLLTVAVVIFSGGSHFDAKIAFDFPPGAFHFSWAFALGLGAASRIGIYDYLGYYDICYIGDEVKEPGRNIPRSIFLSIIAVGMIYFAMNLSIVGVVPWREFVPAENNEKAQFIVSYFMERIYGSKAASVLTVLILWTAFASCFALLLGYSRIPYAAAQDGYFFKVFGTLHPPKNFPYISLLCIGSVAIACSFFELQDIIDALLTTRIAVQFVGQIGAVLLLRRNKGGMKRPYRIWFYPVPAFLALIGWLYLLATTDKKFIFYGSVAFIGGIGVFLIWSRHTKSWPFAIKEPFNRG